MRPGPEKDRYVGEISAETKLRHGKGKYKYPNPYFTYEGDWVDGVKDGQGVLYFADGGRYEGEFKDGEITGYGERIWPDGSRYEGYFEKGEKHAEGKLVDPTGTYVG